MPYDVRESGSGATPWCVHKTETGEKLGCHETKEKAEAQIRAIGARTHAAQEETLMPVTKESALQALDILDQFIASIQATDPELAAELQALVDEVRRLGEEHAPTAPGAPVELPAPAQAALLIQTATLAAKVQQAAKKIPRKRKTIGSRVKSALLTIQRLSRPLEPSASERKLRERRMGRGKSRRDQLDAIRAAIQPELPVETPGLEAQEAQKEEEEPKPKPEELTPEEEEKLEEQQGVEMIEDRGEVWFYTTVMEPGNFTGLHAEPMPEHEGVAIVFGTPEAEPGGLEQIVGYELAKANFPTTADAEAWVGANIMGSEEVSRGRLRGQRIVFQKAKEDEEGAPKPTDEELEAALKVITDGGQAQVGDIDNLIRWVGRVGFNACTTTLSGKEGIFDEDRLCGWLKARARDRGVLSPEHAQDEGEGDMVRPLLVEMGITDPAIIAAVIKKVAELGPDAEITEAMLREIIEAVKAAMAPAETPAPQQAAPSLETSIAKFDCTRCGGTVTKGQLHCPGCGANVREMVGELLEAAGKAIADAAPTPPGDTVVPEQPSAEAVPQPAPVAAPAQNATPLGDITRKGLQNAIVGDGEGKVEFKLHEDDKTGGRYLEGVAMLLAPGPRKDGIADYTPECVRTSIQNFVGADVWFKHRPPIGQVGSEGVLSDKAGRVVEAWLGKDGRGYGRVRISDPGVVEKLLGAQAARLDGFYELSFDGIVQAQEMQSESGSVFDLVHHIPLVRSVDLVDKGAVPGAKFIPQAAGLVQQEETMKKEEAFDLDAAREKRLAFVQNHCTAESYSEAGKSQAVAWAKGLKPSELVVLEPDKLKEKCKEFHIQNAETPDITKAGTPSTTFTQESDPYQKCVKIADSFFNKRSTFPKSLKYMVRCMQNALRIERPVDNEAITQLFRDWSRGQDAFNRLGNAELNISQNSVEPGEVYIEDRDSRLVESHKLTEKAIQNALTSEGKYTEKTHQAAISAATIAAATQDSFEVRKLKKFKSVLDGAGMGVPIGALISETIPVDHTLPVHEVEMQASNVFPQVAELANYSEQIAPQAREWFAGALLFGAYQTYSEEAKKNDRAGVLADLPDNMGEMMAWTEYLHITEPFRLNSNLSDGAPFFSVAAGNQRIGPYTFADLEQSIVTGLNRVDYSVGAGINARHTIWKPVGTFSAPVLWIQFVRDTSLPEKPDTTDRAANMVTHGFGALKNHAQSEWATAGVVTRAVLYGDVADGPIGTMLRYEGRTEPEVFIADDRGAPGPNWLANAIQIKVRHGFRYNPNSRLNVFAMN